MGVFRRLFAVIAFIGAILSGIASASAHPHVWVTAASELLYGADGTITGVRHTWTFDEMFSTFALQGIESKTKGVYTREDLVPLAQTNVESLKEYDFFTYARASKKKQLFTDPVDYYLEHKNGALVLHFTLPFKTPFKASQLSFEIYDPSYFVEFALQKQDPFQLVGGPQDCKIEIKRPEESTAPGTQTLNEDSFLNNENENMGAQFANKIAVNCP